jgi:hypothetical protein
MEQNAIGFPNSMYLHVRPYTPCFGFGYEGIGSAPTMWPPMYDPLGNPTTRLKPIPGIAQARIIINYEEFSMKTMIISKESTTLRCHKSFLPKNIP